MTTFEEIPEVIYTFEPPIRYLIDVSKMNKMIPSNDVNVIEIIYMICTMKDNHKGYTQRQFECDK